MKKFAKKLRWLRILFAAFIIGTMLITSLPVTHISVPTVSVSIPKIDIPWNIAGKQVEIAREWINSRLSDTSRFITENFSLGTQSVEADSANLYAVVGQVTVTSGTATVTGSPARFTAAGGTITVSTTGTNQTFTVTACTGTAATVTSGTATISGSPKACPAATATTVTITNNPGANATCTIAVTYSSTGLWSSGYSWSSTSGGAPNNHAIPTSTNPVFFDANSFGGASETFTNDVAAQACYGMDWSAVTNSPTWAGTTTFSSYNGFVGSASMTNSYTGTITWAATTTGHTITSALAWGSSMTFNGAGGGWTLSGAFNIGPNTITLTNGTLNDGGQIVTCGAFTTASGTNALVMGTSVWNISGASGWVATNLGAITPGTSSIRLTGTSAPFTGNGLTYYEVQMNGQTQTMSGNNQFTNLIKNGAAIANDTLTTSGNLTITGTLTLTGNSVGNRLALKSNTTSARTVTSAANAITYTDFYYILGAGAASWNLAGISGGSADMSGNIGLTLTSTVYWVGGSGSWESGAGAHWSGTSGGTPNADFVPLATINVRFDGNSGFTSISKTVTAEVISIVCSCYNMDWTGSLGGPILANANYVNLYGSVTFVAGMTMTVNSTSGLNFKATTAGQTITSAGIQFQGMTFTGVGGVWTFQDPVSSYYDISLTAAGTINTNNQSVTVSGNPDYGWNQTAGTANFGSSVMAMGSGYGFASASFSNCTVSLGSSNWTLNGVNYGSWSAGAGVTLNAGTSTININNNIFWGGGYTYNNVVMGAGVIGIQGANTFNNLTKTGPASLTGSLYLAANQIVNGTFTVASNSATNRLLVCSYTQGTLYSISASSVSSTNVDWSDIQGVGSSPWNLSTGNNGNAGGNVGITFTTAANDYWVGGAGSWSDPTHWATSSGGSGGSARVPLIQDTAVFDSNSMPASGTVALTASCRLSSIITTGVTTGNLVFSATTAAFYGSTLNLTNTSTWSVTTLDVYSRSTVSLTTGGTLLQAVVIGQGTTSGILNQQDDLNCGAISLAAGTLNMNGHNIYAQTFDTSSTSYTRTLVMGSGNLVLSSTAATTKWNLATSNLSFFPGTATIILTNSTTNAQTFAGGGATYYNLQISGTGNYQTTISGANTFNILVVDRSQAAKTVKLPASTTTTLTTALYIPVYGTTVVTLGSSSTSAATIASSADTFVSDYLNISYSTVPGSIAYYAGSHSTNSGNNTNWIWSDYSGNYPTASSVSATSIATTTAQLNGSVVYTSGFTPVYGYFQYDLTGTYTSPTSTTLTALTSDVSFSATVTNLTSNTTYHFRAVIQYNSTKYSYGSDTTFTTLGAPLVTTGTAANIATSTATLQGNITSMGTYSSVITYFEYGTTIGYGTSTTQSTLTSASAFTFTLTGLAASQTYHFRADVMYASNNSVINGADQSFTTGAMVAPAITTLAAAVITATSATLQGQVTSMGSYSTVSVFFEYGITTAYGGTAPDTNTNMVDIVGYNVTGLSSNTLYHYRADVRYNNGATINGTDATFTTASLTSPSISTLPAVSITSSTATLQAQITSLGNFTSVSVYFEYGTSVSYGTSTVLQTMTSTVAFTQTINALTASTLYHFRADLIYGSGGTVIDGSDNTFTTTAANTPAVFTGVANTITTMTATITATLTSIGTMSSVYVYFEYGTTISYGSTPSYQMFTTTGTFQQSLSGLVAGTIYHYRADVYYASGTIYNGADQTFTTLTIGYPVVSALTPTGIANNGMTLQGSLTSLGNSTVTVEGFVWSPTTQSAPGNVAPTSSGYAGYDTITGSFTTSGTFSYVVSSLAANTTYYIRAFAYNVQGYAYSNQISQLTSNATPIPTAYFAVYSGPLTAPPANATASDTVNLGTPSMPSQFYTEGDVSGIPGGAVINAIFGYSGTPPALWWYPFLYGFIALLSLLFAELTTAKGTVEPSLLTQFIVIEAFLFLLGVLGTAGVSGMIPLYGAFLFPIPAMAIILSKKHYGWG